jgi:hypothetical protein
MADAYPDRPQPSRKSRWEEVPMASYTTDEFRYNRPEGGPKKANDITLIYDNPVEVKGVDGKAPDDPKAEYTLTGDGSRQIKISDIKKGNDDTIKVRIKGPGRALPKIKQAFWTLDGKRIPKALSQLAAAPLDLELDPTTAALEAVEPLLEELRCLSRCAGNESAASK